MNLKHLISLHFNFSDCALVWLVEIQRFKTAYIVFMWVCPVYVVSHRILSNAYSSCLFSSPTFFRGNFFFYLEPNDSSVKVLGYYRMVKSKYVMHQ